MTEVRNDAATSTIRQMLIVLIALGAILMCVLAFHSAVKPTYASTPTTAASAQNSNVVMGPASDAGGVASVSPALPDPASPLIACGQTCTVDGGGLALVCLIVITLAAVVFLARFPTVFPRLLENGRRIIPLIPEVRNHIYLPSLTVLSISRI